MNRPTSFEIPVYRPCLCGNERKYVNECLDSTWISSKGKFIAEFERSFGDFVGVDYCASVCNGTVALHVALLALGIGEGAEVIVPTLTYIASVNAIVYAGAEPVFVDSLPDTWQIDPADVQRKITSRTRAIIVVHLYGHPCEMQQLREIAREHDLFIIEDCAEAIGARYHDKHVGTFGDIATFSFFGNKTITTGEGGMVVTDDQTLHDRVVHFRGQGLAKHREYWHDIIGYNYRMTNICAAIGLAQLERVNELIAKKREIAHWYMDDLRSSSVQAHAEARGVFHSYWMVSILVPESNLRDPLREALADRGIETRPLFYPVHSMPMYSRRFQRHPVAEGLAWRGINLPSWPGLKREQVSSICRHISEFLRS